MTRHEPADDPLMTIGAFSRASLLSVRALRRHHERGLVVPAEVDGDTGYRRYRVSQLPDAVLVKRLRELRVPLATVAEIVRAGDPAVTAKLVAEHTEEMGRQLDALAGVVAALRDAVARPDLHTSVHVRDEPRLHALAVRGVVEGGDYAPFLDEALAALYAGVGRLALVAAGPGGAAYPPVVDRDSEPVVAYVPIVAPVPLDHRAGQLEVVTLPAMRVAVATHAGPYDGLAEAYSQLGAWVTRHATSAERDVHERYVVSHPPPGAPHVDPADFRTQVLWPIRHHGPAATGAGPT